jgi:hypothetical protein
MAKPLVAVSLAGLFFAACSAPKQSVPSLTPGVAAALLQLNPKSKNWLTGVKRQNPACEYRVELPDQSAHPTVIDVQGIVYCGAQPAPRSMNATVSYRYDKESGRWVISRFSS